MTSAIVTIAVLATGLTTAATHPRQPMTTTSSAYGFGYCVDCDRPLERPGWDLVCIQCQQDLDEELSEAAEHADDD